MKRLLILLICARLTSFGAITLEQINTFAQNGTATTISLAFGSTPAASTTALVAVVVSGGVSFTSVTDSLSNTYTSAVASSFQAGAGTCRIYTAPMTNRSSAPTVTATYGSTSTAVIHIMTFTNVNSSGTVNASGAANGASGSTSISAGNLTTTVGNTLLLGFGTFATSPTLTVGSGYSSIASNASGFGTNVFTKTVSSTGTYAVDGTLSASSAWTLCGVALKDVSQSGGSTAIRHRVTGALWSPMLIWDSFYQFLMRAA